MAEIFPESAMEKHGRSFYWASFWLGPYRNDVSCLYRLCRFIDDVADQQSGEKARQALFNLDAAVASNDLSTIFVQTLLQLQARGMPVLAMRILIQAAANEHPFKQPANDAELIRYAFGVAGSVGLMLRPLLNVQDPRADSAAVALGIAMQLTNIARDVAEDVSNNRCYLPQDTCPMRVVKQAALGERDACNAVFTEIIRVLEIAEGFYAEAEAGLHYLPATPRRAVRIALIMYRRIGMQLRSRHLKSSLPAREVVGTFKKTHCVLQALFGVSVAKTELSESNRALLLKLILEARQSHG